MTDKMKYLKKATCFFAVLFLYINTIIAQENGKKLQSFHHGDIFSFGTSYNYELALASSFTITPGVSLISGPYFYYFSQHQNSKFGSSRHMSISFDSRWYTNVDRRARKGKNLENNSANFVSLLLEYIPEYNLLKPEMQYATYAITPRWGFRRSFNQFFFMEFAIGLPYMADNVEPDPYVGLHLGLKAGFAFNRK